MEITMNFIESISVLLSYNVFLKSLRCDDDRHVYSNWKLYIILALIATIWFDIITIKLGISIVIYLTFLILTYTIILCKINKIKFTNNFILIATSVVIILFSKVPQLIIELISNNKEKLPLAFSIILTLSMTVLNVVLLNRLLQRKGRVIIKVVEKYNWITLILLNCFIYFLFIQVLAMNDLLSTQILIQVSILVIVLVFNNIIYIASLYKSMEIEKQKEVRTNINPLIDDLLNKMKAREHEYKNHLNILYCMIQVCNHDELKDRAKAYIGNITESNLLAKVSYIDNTIVKAILFNKLGQAEKEEIDYSFNIESDLNNIAMNDSELTIVLSNLLNNAIEATSVIENKRLNIYIGEQGGKHIIKVSNSTYGLNKEMLNTIFKEGFSTKGENRGYGLYNIKNIIDKHKGEIALSLNDDMLEFKISV